MMGEPGWVDRVWGALLEEQAAGRRRIARERPESFDLEIAAGRERAARSQARFAAEVEAGRRTALNQSRS
jgi:hypothetical protein